MLVFLPQRLIPRLNASSVVPSPTTPLLQPSLFCRKQVIKSALADRSRPSNDVIHRVLERRLGAECLRQPVFKMKLPRAQCNAMDAPAEGCMFSGDCLFFQQYVLYTLLYVEKHVLPLSCL